MKVFRWVINKYVLAASAFMVWMAFFDQNNWTNQRRTFDQLQETKAHIRFLEADIQKMEDEHEALQKNPEALERFARERYQMKRPNEDLYIIKK